MNIGDVINGWKIVGFRNDKYNNVDVVSLDGTKHRHFRLYALKNNKVNSPDKIFEWGKYKNPCNHKLYAYWRRIQKIAKENNLVIEKEWLDYDAFFEYWIKLLPENDKTKCLQTKDPTKGYTKDNCFIGNRGDVGAENLKKADKSKRDYNSPITIEKRRQTCLKKYGTNSPLQNDKIKSKIKQTILEKYGVEYISQSKDFQDKRRQNSINKFGVDHHTKTEEYRNAAKTRAITNGLTHVYDGQTSENISKKLGISLSGFHQRVRKYGYEQAVKMSKNKTSIEAIIEQTLDKLQIRYLTNQSIDKYKPDFILPDFSIIIECDGLYWHSDAVNKDKYYHRNKKDTYKAAGYRALFFREDEIDTKINIIESMIAHRCKLSKSIYARKCEVKELTFKEIKPFMEENHLMGCGSGRAIGLIYNKEIVCAAQIVNKKEYVDISRFCTKSMVNVIGGFSRILSYLPQKRIQTFIDGRYGDGDYLLSLGFELVSNYVSFKWVKNDKTFHRLMYRGNFGYDNNMYKIWDCGQYKYIKNPQTISED